MGRYLGRAGSERGFMMAALLVTMSVMAVLMGMMLPVWSTAARHEREEELVFRGEQYTRAMALFQRKYANARAPSVDVLLNERFLRKKYKDPITNDDFELLAAGAAPAQPGGLGQTGQGQRGQSTGARAAGATPQPQTPGRGAQTGAQTPGVAPGLQAAQAAGGQGGPGLVGVVSKSKDQSLRLYKGQQRYSDWVFMPVQMSTQAGAGAAGSGAAGGRGNQPNGLGGAGGAGLPPGRGRGTGPGGSPGRSTQPPGDGRGFGPPAPQSGQPGFGGFGGRQ